MCAKSYSNFGTVDAAMVDAWNFFLDEYNYNDVAIALKQYVKTSGSAFAPSVSQLIDMVHRPQELNQMSDMEAWQGVRKAISRSSYGAEEQFSKFPEAIKAAVGSPAQLRIWAGDEDFNEGVESSNFYKRYNAVVARSNEINRMPVEARAKLGMMQQEQARLETYD